MKLISDFHIHSRYSRATSKLMVIPEIARMARIKGIDLIGTGDFTHPLWFKSIKKELIEIGNGLLKQKNNPDSPLFILSSEISLIYKYKGKTRKVHLIVLAPDIKTVENINHKLGLIGNICSDGRPILGLNSIDLAKIIFDINNKCVIIPAHIWTPWFSIFGSKSGFDTIGECFEGYEKYIFAAETGLSSDPEMNWQVSMLDPITLISNSDAHSPANLGREATVFEITNINNLSYDNIISLIKNAKLPNYTKQKEKLLYTIEFYPEEGKYHFDGHAPCFMCLNPAQTIKNSSLCPKCGRPITIGVYHRVEKLADRPQGYRPENIPGSRHIIPLQEIIAEYFKVGKKSKKVQNQYEKIIQSLGSEFYVLLDSSEREMNKIMDKKLVSGIMSARNGKVYKFPGYDGIFGKILVFDNKTSHKAYQKTLFES